MRPAKRKVTRNLSVVAMGMLIGIGAAIGQDQTKDRVRSADQTQDPTQDQTQQRDQTQDQTKSRDQVRDQKQIYGSQMMTRQERAEYRKQMQALKTEQEREQFRQEHHKKMQERAKARGMAMPDMPRHERGTMGPRGGGTGQGGGRRGG